MLANIIHVVFFVLFLSACASVDTEKGDITNSIPKATLIGSKKSNSFSNWERYLVLSIDGNEVSSIFRNLASYEITVPPGNRSVLVDAGFNRSWFGGGPYESIIAVKTRFEDGSRYQVQGEVKEDEIIVWVRNIDTNELASEKIRRNFRKTAHRPLVPITIYR